MTIIVTPTASASSRDYAWLKASIAKWAHRSDLAALIPDFVLLAEKRINDYLRASGQETTTSLAATAGDAFVALPADVAEIKSVSIAGSGTLDYLPPESFNVRYAAGASGTPRHYTVIGSTLTLGPTPQAAHQLQCVMRLDLPALTDAAPLNWLIEQRPDLYLAAAMCEVVGYTRDVAALPQWEAKYGAALAALNAAEWGRIGPLAIRSNTNNP